MRTAEDVIVSPADTLRETERRLAAQYGAGKVPKLLDAEDLECEDTADVEHWVEVYTELLDFTRSLMETASSSRTSAASDRASEQASSDLRALAYRARVQELHLTYWSDRLQALRAASDRT
ncbi:MAG: hypothetical protein J2P38_04620 [Candidatus Dormibacteraeota bacterium]|nr:hypothetical protein [Candidatus Dormibacteraeota bacterium]